MPNPMKPALSLALAASRTNNLCPTQYSLCSKVKQASSNINQATAQPNRAHQSFRHLTAFKRKSVKVEVSKLPNKFNMEWPKITLFGDSITRRSMDADNGCWGSLIAYQVGSYFDVDARGFEGYNSKWGLELMPKLFPKSYLDKVEIFIPFFGHNDSWQLIGSKEGLGIPVEDYDKNMRSIIKYLIDNGLDKNKIIMITPTWYHQESFAISLKENNYPSFSKTEEHARKYSDVVLSIAKDHSLDVIDFFKMSLDYKPLESLFCDGVHFSREGAHLLFDQLMPVIQKKIEASFKKPLADLWHVVPVDQHPEVKPVLEAYLAYVKKEKESSS